MEDLLCDKWKQEIVRVLKVFTNFCEQYNLSYYVAYGSAIGAVRHNGFIPWDDDVDVMMPRSDYNKIIDIFKDDIDGCRLLRPLPGNYYYLPFAKLISTNTTLLEERSLRCVIGAFVDIYPMDHLPNDILVAERMIRRYHRNMRCLYFLSSYYSLSTIMEWKRKGQYKKILYSCYFTPFKRIRRRILLRDFAKLVSKTDNYANSDFVGYLGGDFMGRGDIFPKEWFEDYFLVKFENIQVRLCKGYESYLKQIYGNYMELPPLEQRVSWHDVAYKSFEKIMRYKDIKKILVAK